MTFNLRLWIGIMCDSIYLCERLVQVMNLIVYGFYADLD